MEIERDLVEVESLGRRGEVSQPFSDIKCCMERMPDFSEERLERSAALWVFEEDPLRPGVTPSCTFVTREPPLSSKRTPSSPISGKKWFALESGGGGYPHVHFQPKPDLRPWRKGACSDQCIYVRVASILLHVECAALFRLEKG